MKYLKNKLASEFQSVRYLGWQIAGLLLLLLWSACQKGELPPPSSDVPVFIVGFSTDSLNSQSVTAGENEVYLFTRFLLDGQTVISTGTFAKEDCPDGDCPGSLTFEFAHTGLDSTFLLGFYNFIGSDTSPGAPMYLTTFSVLPNSGFNNFSWKIDDANAGQGATLVREFNNDSARLVELTAIAGSGLRSTAQRRVSIANPGSASFPVVSIDIQQDSLFGYQLEAVASGAPAQDFQWSTLDTSNIIFLDFLGENIGVTVIDGNNNTASAQFENLTPNDVPVRSAGFSYTVQKIFPPTFPGNVRIEWVDPQGGIWRSDWNQQPFDAFFQVLESVPYEKNENNQETQKMRVTFSCRLFSATGGGRNFSGSGVIAVARP